MLAFLFTIVYRSVSERLFIPMFLNCRRSLKKKNGIADVLSQKKMAPRVTHRGVTPISTGGVLFLRRPSINHHPSLRPFAHFLRLALQAPAVQLASLAELSRLQTTKRSPLAAPRHQVIFPFPWPSSCLI